MYDLAVEAQGKTILIGLEKVGLVYRGPRDVTVQGVLHDDQPQRPREIEKPIIGVREQFLLLVLVVGQFFEVAECLYAQQRKEFLYERND